MSWHELYAWLRHPEPGGPIVRSVLGDDSEWTLQSQLLAGIFDQLAVANWQRSGGKGPRPRPLPRPGVQNSGQRHYGDAAGRTPDEVKALLRKAAGR